MTIVWQQLGKLTLFLLFSVFTFEIIVLAPKDLADQSNVRLFRRPEDLERFDQIARDLHLVEVKDDEMQWELWADRAEKMAAKDLWGLNDMRAKFYGGKGVQYVVAGKGGSVSQSQDLMKMDGLVDIKSTDGYSFKTVDLHYNPSLNVLEGEGPVEMMGNPRSEQGRPIRLSGTGLRTYTKENRTEILDDVQASKVLPNGLTVKIMAQFAEFQHLAKRALFQNSVRIQYGEMLITGGEAIIQMNVRSGVLETMQMHKGVVITDPYRRAKAQRLDVYFPREELVLEGNPTVEQNSDIIVGERILLLDRGDRVQVTKVKAKVDGQQMEKKQ